MAVHATWWVHGLDGQALFTAPVNLLSPKVMTTYSSAFLVSSFHLPAMVYLSEPLEPSRHTPVKTRISEGEGTETGLLGQDRDRADSRGYHRGGWVKSLLRAKPRRGDQAAAFCPQERNVRDTGSEPCSEPVGAGTSLVLTSLNLFFFQPAIACSCSSMSPLKSMILYPLCSMG